MIMLKAAIYRLIGNDGFVRLRAYKHLAEYKLHRVREPEQGFLPQFVNAGDTCIDVGASLGAYAYSLSQLVGPTGKVYSLEPVPSTYRALTTFLRYARLPNVKSLQLGASNEVQSAQIFVPIADGRPKEGHARIAEGSNQQDGRLEQVELTTIDKLCEDEGISRVDFIKIDIEGAELLALQGAQRVLAEHQPVLLLEIEDDHVAHFDYKCRDLFQFLKDRGYSDVYYFDGQELASLDAETLAATESLEEAMQGRSTHAVNNFFFVPEKTDPAGDTAEAEPQGAKEA